MSEKNCHKEVGKGYIIEHSPLLAEHTSIRLGGRVVARIKFLHQDALQELPEIHKRLGGILTPMGFGSNIIARGGELPLTLISTEHSKDIEIVADEGSTVLVRSNTGVRLPTLQAFAASKGLSGLEGLCGIPGNMGGAAYMNAGSFGMEMGNVLVSLAAMNTSGEIKEYARADLGYSYRKLCLPKESEWFFITSVTLRLLKKTPAEVRSLMQDIYAKKQAVQPLNVWSAGCVFKNPEGNESAGKLLDMLGLKGKRLGGMEFSCKHANFLVNTGKGTSEEAYDLIALAKETVRTKTGIQLQTEVTLWP